MNDTVLCASMPIANRTHLLALAVDGLHFLGAELLDSHVPSLEEGLELRLVLLQVACWGCWINGVTPIGKAEKGKEGLTGREACRARPHQSAPAKQARTPTYPR